jgi:hypothetical protein
MQKLHEDNQPEARVNRALCLAAGIEALVDDASVLDDPLVDLYLALAYDSLRKLISTIGVAPAAISRRANAKHE